MRIDPAEALSSPSMEVMNFLNEATLRYPRAISFAAGRPANRHLETSSVGRWIERFVEHRAREGAIAVRDVWHAVGQYGETNGAIRELVAGFVERDFGIAAPASAVMVTNGFQEALLIALLGLARADGDVVLTCDPTYTGLVGAATLARMSVETLGPELPIGEALDRAVVDAEQGGRRVRACYVIPDFDNPTGRTLSLEERRSLLAVANRRGVPILEDSAYRMFSYDDALPPPLKAIDGDAVLHLGSFAKMLMPGLRAGFLVGSGELVAKALSRVKSFTSVLTAPVIQAAVAGLLVSEDLSLVRFNAARVADYRAQRDVLLRELERRIGGDPTLAGVRWSRPAGGFFASLTLPFTFDAADLEVCARDFGVVVCPMSFFSPRGRFREQMRLSFSNVDEREIIDGIERLHAYLAHRATA